MSGPGCSPSSRNIRAARLGQVPVGQGQHGPHVRRRVARVKRVEPPAELGQLGRERGQRQLRRGGGPGDDDRQRERQPRAQRRELGDGPRLAAARSLPSRATSSSFASCSDSTSSCSSRAPSRAASAASSRRLVTMTRHCGEAGSSGRTCADVGGVVEQHEHPPPGEHRPVQRREPLDVAGQPLRVHPERVEEPAQHVAGIGGPPVARVEPAQVRVQLPVGEAVRDPVRPVQRERGLPDPGGPADRGDHHPGGPDGLVGRRRVEHRRRAARALPPGPRSAAPASAAAVARSRPRRPRPRRRPGRRRRPGPGWPPPAWLARCRRRPGTARQGRSRPPRAARAPARATARTTGKASASARAQGPRWPARTPRTAPPGPPESAQQQPLLTQPFARACLTGMCTHDHPPTRDHPVTESLTCPSLRAKVWQ